MKTIFTAMLKWVSGFFTITVLSRSLAIGNLSFLYADSVNYLNGLYGITLASLGMMMTLLTFHFCQFVKKFKRLTIDDIHIKKSMKFLKAIAIIIALAPVVVNKNFILVDYQNDTLQNIVKSSFEVLKVLGAEYTVGICLWLERKLKK